MQGLRVERDDMTDSTLDMLLSAHHPRIVRGDYRFSANTLNRNLIVEIYKSNHLRRRTRIVEKQINDVTDAVQATINVFGAAVDRLVSTEARVSEVTKKVTGQVRDNAQKLSDGLQRIEKTANFDRLERYVGLLERAAAAMATLAELEATGKLEKIAGAIR
jgi:hypothetical protein